MQTFGPLMDVPARQITKEMVAGIVKVHADQSPHAASRAVSYIRPAVDFFARFELIGWDVLKLGELHQAPVTKRTRILDLQEWVRVWKALDLDSRPQARALQLIMMTGTRNSEAAALKIDELDVEGRVWSLPSDRSKNSDPMAVPLNHTAMQVIKRAMDARQHPKSKYLFTSDGRTPVRLGSKVVNQAMVASNTSGWSPHDLRRTFATGLGEGGVSTELIDLMLNHRASASRSGIGGVYNLSARLPEKRAASDLWAKITTNWLDGKPDIAEVVQPVSHIFR